MTRRNPDGLRGEWWIDDGGGSTFADGDIGDQNHEGIAYWAALGVDPEESTDYRKKTLERNWDEVEELKKKFPDDAELQEADAYDLAKALEDLYPGGGMGDWTVVALLGIGAEPKAVEYFRSHMSDAREYMMEHQGWIRVQNSNFQMHVFDDDALSSIKSFLGDEYPEDEVLEDDTFYIEELSTGKYFSLSGEDIMNSGKTAGDLKFSATKQNPPYSGAEAATRTFRALGDRGFVFFRKEPFSTYFRHPWGGPIIRVAEHRPDTELGLRSYWLNISIIVPRKVTAEMLAENAMDQVLRDPAAAEHISGELETIKAASDRGVRLSRGQAQRAFYLQRLLRRTILNSEL